MSARLLTRQPTWSCAAEVRRLRGQLAAALADRDHFAGMLAELISATAPDPRADQLRELEHAETWAAGYAEGEAAGFALAVTQYKRAQLGAVADLELHLTRWDGTRERFADPRPGDRGPFTAADIETLRARWERWAAGGEF